ncbi:GRIP and coiled-coil domain-containing protein 2-like isoform X2 [Belonocnema kinseyi]|nr:GRIP and coiled-coil domain-containing protein 2-like isoform X2 [Belonocnema kinseyi]
MSESISSMSESTTNKETIEERYNKLRGLAVKLKKKVSDLCEQVKHLEAEKATFNAEREEVQNKVIQISNNAKKLQTIQVEYDKLQDEMEQRKSENKKLMKNIETLVSENASLKESLYNEKESTTQLTARLEQFMKEKHKLENTVKLSQEQIKQLNEELRADAVLREQKAKEYEALKNNLESEVQAHKATRSQLEAIKQERTSNSVLSLEVENYEKSIEDMKSKLNDEESKRTALEKTIDEQLDTISVLNKQISELRSNCLSKSNQVTSLGERNESIKAELNEMRLEAERAQHEIEELVTLLNESKADKSNLLKKIEAMESDKDNLKKEFKSQKEAFENQLRDMAAEISHLNSNLSCSKKENEVLQEEFNGYKRRAQSVLRTKQTQNKEIGMGGKSVIEIEEELVQSHQQNTLLLEKLDIYGDKVDSLNKEMMILKDERDHAWESLKESKKREFNSRFEISSLAEQCRSQEIKIQKLNLDHNKEIAILAKNHKAEIRLAREKFEQEIQNLKLELEKIKMSESSETARRNNISPERIIDSNPESNNLRGLGMSLIEREECEGSESVDSCPLGMTNTERYRDRSLMPLDELLNSSDDYNPPEVQILPSKVSRQEFEVCERRVKHLTVLLADAERDIAKLTQLNEMLKEDIRRQQRSVEREQHANNFEYMKNVVFKFVTLKNGDERSHLIPVLTTILKLSPDETQKLNSVAGVSGKSWIPGIPIPGWHNN